MPSTQRVSKSRCYALLLGAIVFLQSAFVSAIPVLPGLQGYGTSTKAGRGGQILRVTNLNDSGAGSLRDALLQRGSRVVVFEVSGDIKLRSDIYINSPYVTVAGQTAPSPGITLRNGALRIKTHDVLVQHLRIRVGDWSVGEHFSNRDGLGISGDSSGNKQVYNVVVDHCSISWAVDEGVATWYKGVHDLTFNANIISENLSYSRHPSGEHSKGMLIGDYTERVAVVRNLFAHNRRRNPLMKGGTAVAIVNNVVYNPGTAAIHFDDDGQRDTSRASVVGNVVKYGPSTKRTRPTFSPVFIDDDIARGTWIYVDDNEAPTGNSDPWSIVEEGPSFYLRSGSEQAWPNGLVAMDGDDTFEHVMRNAGARPKDRDSVDERVIRETREGKGRIINSQNDVGGWPSLAERQRKLYPPSNPHSDDDGDGYTNLEEWLHGYARGVERDSTLDPSDDDPPSSAPPPEEHMRVTTASVPNATVGQSYAKTLQANQGGGRWRIHSGSLPSGMRLSESGVLSGTPNQAESRTFTVLYTTSSQSDKQVLTLTVRSGDNDSTNDRNDDGGDSSTPLRITTDDVPAGRVGRDYRVQLRATQSGSWSVVTGSLPRGLRLTSSGLITGSPSSTANNVLIVQLKNGKASDREGLRLKVTN